jgi:hypothetical protein
MQNVVAFVAYVELDKIIINLLIFVEIINLNFTIFLVFNSSKLILQYGHVGL